MRLASLNAGELCRTEAERACLSSLRELSAQSDGPLERHGVRVVLLALELAARGGWTVDRELLLCAALLHDVGLLPGAATSDLYVRDGRRVAESLLRSLGWPSERLALLGRDGFGRDIGRLVGRALCERPTTVPRIFAPAQR